MEASRVTIVLMNTQAERGSYGRGLLALRQQMKWNAQRPRVTALRSRLQMR
ncbi:hypothetical protein RESH_04352 [Rhodopirellula europaea SH398]|jgi:hypothetical protein|uniref:Uncharacterized protein n=1 Tax=Rhodopirellula europaea SH398 TaxID=1263868 RepID=M5SFV8_9BACT|nr:hypothetical protein RESH_04352 [Rhodopirellula europaea SH398]|tara:strand:- start:309 stop:461 length:153 start_codon:yes stop_codon:yes gene_type:complete